MASLVSGAPTDTPANPANGGAEALAAPISPEAQEDSLAFLKALAEASAVFIALTFVGGWSYLASYYRTFGLNPLELDISIPVVSTIAVYVLYQSVWPLAVAFALILVFAILAARRRRLRRSRQLGRGPIVAALAILLLTAATAGVVHGTKLAKQDMLETSPTLPYVAFASTVENLGPSCVDFKTYGSTDCKLLLHFNNAYYYFQPLPEGSDLNAGSVNVFRIEDSDVVAVHVQRSLDHGDPRIE
jgi:hypothetical protein